VGAAFLSDRSRPFAAAVPGRPGLSEGLTTVLSWIGAAFLESPRAVCCVCLAGCGTPLSTYSSNPETNPHSNMHIRSQNIPDLSGRTEDAPREGPVCFETGCGFGKGV
jgi:hypothetical protein